MCMLTNLIAAPHVHVIQTRLASTSLSSSPQYSVLEEEGLGGNAEIGGRHGARHRQRPAVGSPSAERISGSVATALTNRAKARLSSASRMSVLKLSKS